MAGQIRPSKKCMKIAYKILQTPKDQQQDNQPKVSPEKERAWFRDSSMSQ